MTRRMIVWGLLAVGVIILALALINGWNDFARMLPWTAQHRAASAEAQLVPALATAKALDTVATQTPAIRAEQKETEHAVDELQGSDAPLPAGYGADLERLRHNGKRNHP